MSKSLHEKRWSTAHEDEDSSEFDLDELLETDTLWEEWDARWEEKHEEDQKREEARMGATYEKMMAEASELPDEKSW